MDETSACQPKRSFTEHLFFPSFSILHPVLWMRNQPPNQREVLQSTCSVHPSLSSILFYGWDISLPTKEKFYRAPVLSILLYPSSCSMDETSACQSPSCSLRMLNSDSDAETERRTQAFRMKCLRRLFRISWLNKGPTILSDSWLLRFRGPQELLVVRGKRKEIDVGWPRHPPWHLAEDQPVGQPGARKAQRQTERRAGQRPVKTGPTKNG